MTMSSKHSNRPAWSISDFYKRSWNLIKKNKKLLLLGVAVVVLSGGGGNGNSSGGNSNSGGRSDIENFSQEYERFDEENTESQTVINDDFTTNEDYLAKVKEEGSSEQKIAVVVVENEDGLTKVWEEVFLKGFKQVGVLIYVILALEIIAFIILIIVFSYAASSWAQASLIKGVAVADTQKTWSLFKVAKGVWPRVGSLIWIDIIPWLVFYFAFAGIAIVGGIAVFAFSKMAVGMIFNVIIVTGGVAALLYFIFRTAMSQIFAKRYSVIDDLSGSDAWRLGWKTSKGNIMKMVRLTIMNAFTGLFAGIAIFIPFMGVLGAMYVIFSPGDMDMDTFFSTLSTAKIAGIVFPIVISGMVMFIAYSLFSVFWSTFIYSVHHYAFLSLRTDLKEMSKDE